MDLSNLKPADGATKKVKRIGRGAGSGHGGTSTRGHKGAGSRSGNSRKIGFEGGQMPLQRRVPKFGFKNPGKVTFKVLNLDDLQKLSETYNTNTLDIAFFQGHGLVAKKDKVKVLGRGAVSASVSVTAHAFFETAKAQIEKAGGSTNLVS